MSTRLYLCFEQTPQWYKKNKLLFLFDRNACRVISDLEYLIRKKFGISSTCNLYLDGYLLPSRENIEIVRDGDNLRVENEAVESNDQEEPSLPSKKRKMPTSKSSFGKSGANSFGNTKSSSKRQKNMFSKASVPDLPSTSSSSSSDDDSDDEDSSTDDSSTATAPSSRKPQNNTTAMRRLSNHATKFSNKQQLNKNKISPFKQLPSSSSSESSSSSSKTKFSNKPEIKKKKISAVSQIPFTSSSSSSSESTSSSESQNAKMPLSSRKQTIKKTSTNKSLQLHVYSLRSSLKPKRTAQEKGKSGKNTTKVLAGPSSNLNGSSSNQSKKKKTSSSTNTQGKGKNDKKATTQLAGPSSDQSKKKNTSSSTKASTAKSSSTAKQAENSTSNMPSKESQKDSLNNNVTTQSNSVSERSANSITSTKKPPSSTMKQSMDSSTYTPPLPGRDNQLLSNSFLSRAIPLTTRSLNSSHIHFGSDDDDATPIATQQPQITPNEAEQIHKHNSLSSYQNDDRMLNNQAHSLTEQMTTTQVPIQTSNFNGSLNDEHVIQENCKARKEIDYNMLLSLCGPPRSGDRIAYKLLEISASYTPEISEYKEGVVLSYDPTNCEVLVELTPESLVKPVGDGNVSNKFELISGDEEEEDDYFNRPPPVLERKVTVGWSSMISPKLMNT